MFRDIPATSAMLSYFKSTETPIIWYIVYNPFRYTHYEINYNSINAYYFWLDTRIQTNKHPVSCKDSVYSYPDAGHVITAILTHMCLVDPSILIYWTSPFPILGVSGVLFNLYSISNRCSRWQTVKTLIRRRVLRRLIWVCTVCLCPKVQKMGR